MSNNKHVVRDFKEFYVELVEELIKMDLAPPKEHEMRIVIKWYDYQPVLGVTKAAIEINTKRALKKRLVPSIDTKNTGLNLVKLYENNGVI